MAYENIIVKKKGKVGLITLNRPDALNALNTELNIELGKALDKFEAKDDRIGCIVITGSEKGVRGGRRRQGDAAQDVYGGLQGRLYP